VNVFGVIGGLGPRATSKLYLELNRRFLEKYEHYPQILIDSVSFPQKLEQEIIRQCKNENSMLPFLLKSVKRLNTAGANFLVMPCNTLHVFIEELRRGSKVPVLSIVDETTRVIKQKGYRKIGLLATSKTIKSELFDNGFEVILPDEKDQDEIPKIELQILKNRITQKDRIFMSKIIEKLSKQGSDAILIGCTDLHLVIDTDRYNIDIIDTLEVLIDSSFERMIRGNSK
jgi:aspartate racemase